MGYPKDSDFRACRTTGKNIPTIVCLCGSTRFYEAFQEANYIETMAGKIVLSVGFYPHAQDKAHGEERGCTPEQKVALDELHKRKIDLADEILVVSDESGYFGNSTLSEISYAASHDKKIHFVHPKAYERWEFLARKEGSK